MTDLDVAEFAEGGATIAPKTKRMLNVRVMVGSLIAVAVILAGFYAWGELQMRRLAAALVIEAGDMAKRNRFLDAANCLTQFLEVRPGWRYNPTVKVYRAQYYDRGAADADSKRHATELYRDAIKTADPGERRTMLARLGNLLYEIGEFEAAKQSARELLDSDKDNPKAWRVLALANYELFRAGRLTSADKDLQSAAEGEIQAHAGQPVTVGITLQHAHRLNPADIQVAERLALVYRSEPALLPAAQGARAKDKGPAGKTIPAEEQRALASDQVIAEMVAARPKDADAQLALFRHLMAYKVRLPQEGKADTGPALKQARQAIADAVRCYRPDQPAVLMVAGDLARWEAKAAAGADAPAEARRLREAARKYYEQAIRFITAGAPGESERAYFGLSETLAADGDTPAALDSLRRGFEHCNHNSIYLALCRVEVLMGRSQEGDLREVEQILPVIYDLLHKVRPVVRLRFQPLADMWRATLLARQGKCAEALPLLTALTDVPKTAGEGEADRAFSIPPKIVFQAWLLLGATHADRKEWDQALTAFDAAAARDRKAVVPCLQAAAVCVDADRPAKARKYYEQALTALAASDDPPEEQRHFVYTRLIELLDQANRGSEAERYLALRNELTAKSAALTRQDVEQAISADNQAEAMALALRGVQSRPQDPWAHLALGRACRAKHEHAKADAAYRKAVELAHGKPTTVTELADFLVARADPLDRLTAEAALRGVLEQSADAGLRLVELLVQRRQEDDAVTTAQTCVRSQPNDPLAQIAMGKAWWAKRDLGKAEAAFQEAVRRAGTSTRPLRALFNFYAGSGQADKARATLEQIPLGPGATGVEQALFLADGYTGLGFRPLAELAYQRAVEAAMDDPAVTLRQAEFLLQSNDSTEAAEGDKRLRNIVKDYAPARHALVAHLLARSDEACWQEARQLLDSAPGDATARQDRLALALTLLDRSGNKNLEKAAGICRALLAEGRDLTPQIHVALAQIYDAQNKPADAQREYRVRVDNDRALDAEMTGQYADFLVRRGPPAEAEVWLRKLEILAPDVAETVELRARWLRQQERSAEIEPLVEALAKRRLAAIAPGNPAQEAQVAEIVSRLYRRIEQYPAAERWGRRAIALAPERFEQLARALIAQGRVSEALAVCSEAAEHNNTSRPAMLMTSALLCGRATAADLERVEPLLRKALDNDSHPDLLTNVLLARSFLRPQEADKFIALYRRAHQRWPQHVGVLNNLANLLAEKSEPESRKEALDCVDRAIQLAGQRPMLLDTKGMVLFLAGMPDQAVPLLSEAVAVPEPSRFFHLALAYDRLGRREQARTALADAHKGGMKRELLSVRERTLLAELEKKLDR